MTATASPSPAHLASRWLLGLETVFVIGPVALVAMFLTFLFVIYAGMGMFALGSGTAEPGMAMTFLATCASALLSLAYLGVVGQLSIRYIVGGRPAIARISVFERALILVGAAILPAWLIAHVVSPAGVIDGTAAILLPTAALLVPVLHLYAAKLIANHRAAAGERQG